MNTKNIQIKNVGRYFCAAFRNKVSFVSVFIFLCVGSFSALAQIVTENNVAAVDKNYKIGVGDVLKVVVVKQELLSLENVRVGNEGAIKLPMLTEDIPAECLTETELAAAITNKYKKYILNPQVFVAVKEFNSNPVAVVGAVIAPGRFQLQRPVRLLELLTFVNGPTLNAGKSVEIIRSSGTNRCEQDSTKKNIVTVVDESPQEIISLPLADVMNGVENANPFLQAGDVVRIGEAEQSFAYVIGNVKSAAAINLKEPVTLSKALAIVGGVSSGAQIEKIKISRQIPGSLSKTDIIVNFKDIDKRNQADILLQPDDIVDVPGASGTRKFLKDIIRTIVPAVTRLPIIIP